MNPLDYELYNASAGPAMVYACRRCTDRSCSCKAYPGVAGPFGCPCGETAEWRLV